MRHDSLEIACDLGKNFWVEAIPPETNTTIIWQNPYATGTPEAREYTWSEVMGEMVQSTCDRIAREHRNRGSPLYMSNPEIQWAEDEITRIYRKVLRSEANLSDYKESCDNWLKVVMTNLN